ncbi:ATP-binding cassette domain-containing protein [Desulfosporosinus hippei]|uniref:ABC-2 type transport system ATP-binding protein n=1 Tax=Desulfosporosinus hippei DSM 8344 TaxID=1121419 RepID=A0A1G7RKJ3_9FIRM|nr:ATP-binding cassette domain-containing protein [Desulfosporosinus hippei]SDG11194.1 ABC-2 type transport system ATP-binding protein [Desulfosporosinus hippei DSM 8344]
MKVIQSHNLSKSYGKTTALNDLTFEIEENTITGLIGRNGAGKTTLLKIMAGHIQPTHGELRIYSQKPFNNLERSAGTILIDDSMMYPDSFRLVDILSEVAPFYANWNNTLANGLFDYFSFNPNQLHSNLSKGSKSTFNSIIGIASRCPLTLFDEPTTGMDSAVRKDFYKALLKDYLKHPRTIILSSHLLSELEEILEEILLIKQGSKRLHLPVMELKELAVGIRGNAQILQPFVEGKELIYREEFAKDNLYIVLRKELLQQEGEVMKQKGLEVFPISTDDLCVYLTASNKGGIDNVFKKD